LAQAKGILPKAREETEALYRNPMMCGYWVGVRLRPDLDREDARRWFATVSPLVDQLVERLAPAPGQVEGDKVAAVAVGLAPSFFTLNGVPRFDPPVEPPAGVDSGTPESPNLLPWDASALSGVTRDDSDIVFYVASVFEARVARFIEQLESTGPDVQSLGVLRGYQRLGGTEPFGYQDGVRNIPRGVRSQHVFVHLETEPDEPAWADGGSYMTYLRIGQHRDVFEGLRDSTAQDNVICRTRDGTRLDLVDARADPKSEPAEPAPPLPPSSHVRKAAPRGRHDDVQIFRRGLPFMEVVDGRVRVGLNFASFQANLDRFDTVLNDWMLSPNFPEDGAGPDALFDPHLGLTTIERMGLYFVPPYDERGLAATLFDARPRGASEGRLVVRKRVVDPADPNRRFERGGFVFRVLDDAGHPVGDNFTSDSSGRAVFGGALSIGANYTLVEVSSPVTNVPPLSVPFQMTRANQQLRVLNTVTQPDTPYGG
jgi:Dyp-type peroxidase family